MRYYKIISNGYLDVIGTGGSEKSSSTITVGEYESIRAFIATRPTPASGYGYRLTGELTWELYALPVEEDPEVTDGEALEELTEVLNEEE